MMAFSTERQDETSNASRPNGSGENNGKAHRVPRRKSRVALRIICGVNGMCALIFGAIMMIWPIDTPMGLSEIIPLIQAMPLPAFMTETLFWPGLALLLMNGVANLIASALFIAKPPLDRAAISWALIAGILLVCWCVFEMVYLPNAAAVFYLLVAIAQIALSARRLHR